MPKDSEANIVLFAIDTVFYASEATNNAAIRRVQKQINLANPWFKEWKITLNPTKTKAIIFTNQSMYQAPSLHFENIHLSWSKTVKYLGVTIDSKLTFKAHTKTALHKATGARYILFPLLNELSPLPLKTKLYLYNSYIKPILLCAHPRVGTKYN